MVSLRNTLVDTGCKLNVHKTFRRRPGRFLNVLYTFNLRPVSTGTAAIISEFFKKHQKFFLNYAQVLVYCADVAFKIEHIYIF